MVFIRSMSAPRTLKSAVVENGQRHVTGDLCCQFRKLNASQQQEFLERMREV